MEEQSSLLLASLLHGAGQRLLCEHRRVHQRHPSALGALLCHGAPPAAVEQGPLRPWAELVIRSYWACGGRTTTSAQRHALEIVAAAFAVGMSALNILDDVIDGDEPDGGHQGPNLALAFISESLALLARLPAAHSASLVACWSESWARCAAAQAQDVACAADDSLTVDQALAVATGSGLFTRWAADAGAALAGTGNHLRAPLAAFSQHLGTAEKLLHDVHDVWPGDHPTRDLHRPSCNLALVVARQEGAIPGAYDREVTANDTPLRQRLLESGALHVAWAYADWYRLQAAEALERFAEAGGDAAPLIPVLALSPELCTMKTEQAADQIAWNSRVS